MLGKGSKTVGDVTSHFTWDASGTPQISADLLDRTAVAMGRLNSPPYDELVVKLRDVAANYLIEMSLLPYDGTPGEQRQALRDVRAALLKTHEAMGAIAPEYAVAVGFQERTGLADAECLFQKTETAIEHLTVAIDRFDENYKPKRGPRTNLELEIAVRALCAIMSDATGKFPTVSMNKAVGGSPTLRSASAKAIGLLLTSIDPRLAERTIVNMIEKVRQQPDESESHFRAIFESDPDFALDASLLRNRHGD